MSKNSILKHLNDFAVKEERNLNLESISELDICGSVDVVFLPSEQPILIAAGETKEGVDSIKTSMFGDELRIEQEGINLVFGNSTIIGSVNNCIISDGDVHISSMSIGKKKVTIIKGDKQVNATQIINTTSISYGKVVVGIGLPQMPELSVSGSSTVSLQNMKQRKLEVTLSGSAKIVAKGQVDQLKVKLSGSGKANVQNLIADFAQLNVSGSGKINAYVKTQVDARVSGSGEVYIHGNPVKRSHKVTGSGDIEFA